MVSQWETDLTDPFGNAVNPVYGWGGVCDGMRMHE